MSKVLQIFECKVARHGNMLVGKTGAGKSTALRCLARVLGRIKRNPPPLLTGDDRFQHVHIHTLNPLALSNEELYGSFDSATHEWQDGVLARIMRMVCRDESPDQKWILFDGPVDTLWIESMNTTLDDNKLLTLLSGRYMCACGVCASRQMCKAELGLHSLNTTVALTAGVHVYQFQNTSTHLLMAHFNTTPWLLLVRRWYR